MRSQTIVKDFMSSPVITVLPATALKDAVQLLSENHFSGLPVVNDQEQLIGEITEQDLMVRESGIDAGPYVLLLDSVIYLRNPLNWDKQVHKFWVTLLKTLCVAIPTVVKRHCRWQKPPQCLTHAKHNDYL